MQAPIQPPTTKKTASSTCLKKCVVVSESEARSAPRKEQGAWTDLYERLKSKCQLSAPADNKGQHKQK